MSGQTSDIVVTMHFDPMIGIVDLQERIDDLSREAASRGFGFDRHGARNELHAATFRLPGMSIIRLAASPGGAIAIEARPAS
ncbi:hypothetical protein [Sphingomonas nostoxanthinifaciens]|uniref:hypothetical protein n=1 Tax=Sphingomonas nostoxanthinifaciens TaxID=2872652 RepID=UPI001CC1F3E9|nr:hypothetical protein [Sphingomonas nostoxanthinifaciens]UAK24857.1 hypothetical protein K8P63_01145 [Sphingomonas nostoxanthinifaciens]